MTCQQTQELLHGYLDGELDPLGNLNIERHFDDCEKCAIEYRNQLALRSMISGRAQYFEAPDMLKKRIQNAIREESKDALESRHVSHWWWRIAAGVAAFALLAALVWMFLSMRTRPTSADLLAQEVVSSHVRSMMANHLTDVLSSDQHTVKPWFDGKLDFAPVVKDLAPEGFPLVGGRLDYLSNRTVAALVYQRRKHYINLFVWPANDANTSSIKESARQGFNVMCWTAGGTNYCAVSDVNSNDLQEFVHLIQTN
ncbi:MAG TPA: anti-sigma factor [Pyrinomonadaceae bacterium]|nr:anti-sigma factor [Pyrinomonadaceae bacterium]